jgi:hypothetical protein
LKVWEPTPPTERETASEKTRRGSPLELRVLRLPRSSLLRISSKSEATVLVGWAGTCADLGVSEETDVLDFVGSEEEEEGVCGEEVVEAAGQNAGVHDFTWAVVADWLGQFLDTRFVGGRCGRLSLAWKCRRAAERRDAGKSGEIIDHVNLRSAHG